jgi:hypothetical protein
VSLFIKLMVALGSLLFQNLFFAISVEGVHWRIFILDFVHNSS